jgi:monoterpene epsilon-lactone hydrolase
MSVTRGLVGLLPNSLKSAEALHRRVSRPRIAAPVPRALRRRCTVATQVVGGFDVLTLRPHDVDTAGRHMLYLPGGAYVSPMIGAQWSIIGALMRRTPVTVTVAMYPLAPEYTVEHGLAFLDAVGANLAIDNGIERLVYAGDSAGGGLALAHVLHQRDSGIGRRPDGLVLFAPWVDATMSNPDIAALEARDTMLYAPALRTCGAWWAGRRDVTDPSVSPIYANMSGLPPVSIFQGGHDLLLPDAALLCERIQEAGGSSSLVVAEDGFHVYVAAWWTPEARHALGLAAEAIAGTRGVAD